MSVITGKKPSIISFISPVNLETTQVLAGVMVEAANEGYDEIHLLFSTPGGLVAEGITLYNLIRALPVPVHTYNMGTVDSIGNMVYLAGQKRFSAVSSSFTFHGVGFDVPPGTRWELKDLNEKVDSVENDQALIAEIIERHTELSRGRIDSLFLQMAHINAQEALKYGITHKVCDINLPDGVPVVQLVFQG